MRIVRFNLGVLVMLGQIQAGFEVSTVGHAAFAGLVLIVHSPEAALYLGISANVSACGWLVCYLIQRGRDR